MFEPLTRIPQRERLDSLPHLRVSFDAISFTSSTSTRGGNAKVIQATVRTEAGNEDIVAVKKLNYPEGMDIRKFSNEFVHEVETLAGLSHENVVRLIGFAEDLEHGEAWIVLPWQPNGNVSEFLATGEWKIPERISLIQDTFEGLTYLHSRKPPICHGDLKSLNILVNSSYRAMITDFGSARGLDELADRVVQEDRDLATTEYPTKEGATIQVRATGNHLTLTGPAWSLRWASPEILSGATPSLPSDIWSAGWICWEIMTNQVPFPELNSEGGIVWTVIQGKVPSVHEAQLSQIIRLCSLMMDCWKFDPKDRPSIGHCRNEVAWMPSAPPSGANAPSYKLLLEIGELHISQGRYEEATSRFQQALAAAQSASGSQAIAKALFALGKSYYLQTKYSEAEESFAQAQHIYTRIGDDQGLARALQGLGDLYYVQTKYSETEECLVQARQIYTRTGDGQGQANALEGLGKLYRSQAKYSEAEESFGQAQQIYSGTGDDQGRAHALRGLGNVYYLQTKFSDAEECLIQARQIYTRIGDDRGQAHALRALGNLYHAQTKYREAEECLVQARQISTRIGDDLSWANALRGLGNLYYIQTRYREAEQCLVQAQQIYAHTGDDQGRASALKALGDIYSSQTNYSVAEDFYIQAQEIYIRIGNDQGRANALLGLGHLYCLQTKYPEAEESFVQAQQIFSRTGDGLGWANALQRARRHLLLSNQILRGPRLLYPSAADLHSHWP
ncbi:hypothetical protein M407DRAFT_29045 [Tulasnella calospora MUT 4182]|uniref:Protein kinase domain-containing protein n=1 Tax=Tulasnella calospora MUT 4182 TaxID=1051891 RepID=A0A0C3LIX8_9AGAM|nr:hypothetical protein M407DRAFT_29045 [Tulasnella calospora MUT 4182]